MRWRFMLTVIVLLLEIHVDYTSGEDARHLGAKERTDFGEIARRNFVAAILGEEGWNGIFGEFRNTLIISGLGEGRISAP
jgi:hypothetical protein